MRKITKSNSACKQDIETSKRGKKLEELYAGFFGSKENCEIFAKLIPEEFYTRKNVAIVDAGSSMGILGNYIREKFELHGVAVKLVMIDTNKTSMENSPVKAEKIEGDLLANPLPEECADLIILRSVLQYADTKDQVKLLKGLSANLKPGGILISQFGCYDSQAQATAVNKIFACGQRNVWFCSKEEDIEIHTAVFCNISKPVTGPVLKETLDDFFVERIKASTKQIKDANKYISKNLADLGDALTNTTAPFSWQIPYLIMKCKKNKHKL